MNSLFVIAFAVTLASADIGLDLKYGISSQSSHGIPQLKFGSTKQGFSSDSYELGGKQGLSSGIYELGSKQGFSGGSYELGRKQGVSSGNYELGSKQGLSSGNNGYSTGNYEQNLQGNLHSITQISEPTLFYPPPISPPVPPSVYFIGTSTPSPIYHSSSVFTPVESSHILEAQRVIPIPRPQFNGAAYHQQAYHASHNPYQTLSQHGSYIKKAYQSQVNIEQSQQAPQVFKHFYVHAAPEDPEPPKRQHTITLPPPQKHYKIIFIKTPTVAAPPPQIIPVPQQNEEKTIVYVLAKKPEDAQLIDIPKFEAKPPAKPEVFFIKYNSKDESQSLINNIVNDYSKVETVTFAGPEASGQYLGTQTGASNQQFSKNEKFSHSSDSNKYVSVDTIKYATDSGHSIHETLPITSHASNEIQYTGSVGYTGSIGLANKFGEDASQTSSSTEQLSQVTAIKTEKESSGEQDIKVTSPVVASLSSTETVQSITSTTNESGPFENTFSLTQHVPHETYGPPKFRS